MLSLSSCDHSQASEYEPRRRSARKFVLSTYIQKGKNERFSVEAVVTPDLAEEMLTYNTRNGPLSKTNVLKYARSMTEGRWRMTPQAISFTNDGVLLDGQHRLKAIVASGASIPMIVWFGWEPDTFTVMDGGRTRSAGYTLGIKSNIDGLKSHPNATALSATARLLSVVRGERVTDVHAQFLYAENMDQEIAQEAIRASGRGKKVAATSTLALAYYWIATQTNKRRMLTEFWDKLTTGANMSKGGFLRFRERLVEEKVLSRASYSTQIKVAGQIIQAWNCYCQGKGVFVDWIDTTRLPEVI